MRLFRREDEGGFTLADWDAGFAGLNRNNKPNKAVRFQFERWPCCPGSFELNFELWGLMFVVYNEGGPCQLEAYLEDDDEPIFEPVTPVQTAVPSNGSDWHTVPYPLTR